MKFCGSVPAVKRIMNQYDLFLSSSFSETFGMAVLEATCAKLPLLLSSIPAFIEIAPLGSLFFDPFDKNDLAEQLNNCLRNSCFIKDAEYEKIIKKYTPDNFLAQLNRVYND